MELTRCNLESGDSGAWVIDATTGDIYGVLVARSAMMQEGYVIPACDIIDDIRRSTKARELRVPTMNDVLCLASRYGNLDLVKSLIAVGVVINERPGFPKRFSTALLEAAEHKQSEVMKVLLSTGANFNEKGGQQYRQIPKLSADLEHTHPVEDESCVAEDHPESSLSVSSRVSTVGVQTRSQDAGVFSKLHETGGTRTDAFEERQNPKNLRSGYSPLDMWVRTRHEHEELALSVKTSRSFAKTMDEMELKGKQINRQD